MAEMYQGILTNFSNRVFEEKRLNPSWMDSAAQGSFDYGDASLREASPPLRITIYLDAGLASTNDFTTMLFG
jgi:hypothetical protein